MADLIIQSEGNPKGRFRAAEVLRPVILALLGTSCLCVCWHRPPMMTRSPSRTLGSRSVRHLQNARVRGGARIIHLPMMCVMGYILTVNSHEYIYIYIYTYTHLSLSLYIYIYVCTHMYHIYYHV